MSNVLIPKFTTNDILERGEAPTNLQLGELALSGVNNGEGGTNLTLWIGMGAGERPIEVAGGVRESWAGGGDMSRYLPITGGTMEGNINLGTNGWLEGTTTSGGVFSILGLIDPTRFQVGGSYPSLELKGKDARPTYNDGDVALLSDVNKKADDYSLLLYNGTGGNPKPVKFATVDYSSCDSENGVAIKIGMVSGHGNGTAYAFLQEAIVRVNYLGTVEVDNFKYYGVETPTYDGAIRQYGDIFWVIDTTNKIVDFYCLMGQYARLNQIPWKRLTYSSGGTITQYTSATVYSSGTIVWGNNSNIATMSAVQSYIETTLVNGAW